MRDIITLSVALIGICLVSGLALALTWKGTHEQIALQNREVQQQALAAVLPAGTMVQEHSAKEGPIEQYWSAADDTGVVAFAFSVAARGYAADVRLMVGVDMQGTLTGISILEQSETPGLGDRMTEVATSRMLWNGLFVREDPSPPWFCRQFSGLSVQHDIGIVRGGEWYTLDEPSRKALRERNAVTALTGATQSTRAVTSALTVRAASLLKSLRTEHAHATQ